MKVKFWLLDVNYEVKNHKPEIWLWGLDDSGNRVLIVDRSFLAYFYAVVKEGFDAGKVLKEVESKKAEYPFLVRFEVVEKKFFGKPVKALKVYCRDPDVIAKYARAFRKIEGVKECFEDDIRYSMRYLIDNGVIPCGWHEVEVVEEAKDFSVQVDHVYVAKSPPKFFERTDFPNLRILGFSAICYSREGSPKPDRNSVVIISAATNSGEERQFLAGEDKNDKPVLEAFIDYVRSFDPDILIGFGVNRQDWAYLSERCKRLGMLLSIDRVGTEPHTSVYGHVSITGRANVDIFDFADEFPDVKVKTLENLADYLGVMKIEKRVLIEDVEFADYWDDKAKREILKKFSMENTRCIMGIAEAILDFAMQLSSLVGLPIDHVGTAAVGFRVEWFLIKYAHKIGELVPKRVEQPYRPYVGAIVLSPKPGLHKNIAVLDFASMYPNLMISYNLSPDTYVTPKEPIPPCGVYEAPEVKHRFRKEPSGFYKEVLSHLISIRNEIRAKMKECAPDSVEYRVLDARQKAVKVITNASYGYAGWIGARWYIKPVAEAATAWGRHTILTAIKMAEEEGLTVVYGDTDSIFIKYEPEKVERLTSKICEKLGLEIKPDKVYTRIFFTEAKKRYAGLLPDGRLDVVGLEVIRGDWAVVAKKVQERVLEIVLKEQSPQKAASFTQQFIYELRQRRVPYRDLIIWKTLTKPIEEYAVKASHVEAAKMLMEKGWKLAMGDKVGYVVVVGTGRLYERVKPYMFATYDEVDIEYYVTNQVVPAAARILECFGITGEQLLTAKASDKERETRRLTDFF
ncbi:MAG: DNA polymerase domain-containing protein [Candidatus Bathyarchaeota archaeon]|jgi:DNA polymerase I|nr:DNA polymerase II [Candidatus Bathyarchaeota archaeon A05DMB-3]MDH7607513.1 DNA polymerase domain-containing protein [Candidatus Bathyarchaeota archaeon]